MLRRQRVAVKGPSPRRISDYYHLLQMLLRSLARALWSSRCWQQQQHFHIPSVKLDLTRTVKTKSSVKKRFKIKPGGAISRLQGGKRHLLMCKSRSRINDLGPQVLIREGAVRLNCTFFADM